MGKQEVNIDGFKYRDILKQRAQSRMGISVICSRSNDQTRIRAVRALRQTSSRDTFHPTKWTILSSEHMNTVTPLSLELVEVGSRLAGDSIPRCIARGFRVRFRERKLRSRQFKLIKSYKARHLVIFRISKYQWVGVSVRMVST